MKDDLETQMLMEFAGGKCLEALQILVLTLTNDGKDQELQHLQTCVGEIFKRAAQCRAEGKQMAIAVDDQQQLH